MSEAVGGIIGEKALQGGLNNPLDEYDDMVPDDVHTENKLPRFEGSFNQKSSSLNQS